MMKKIFAVIMMLLTILSLAACGSTDSDEPDIIGMPNPFTDFDTLAEAQKADRQDGDEAPVNGCLPCRHHSRCVRTQKPRTGEYER